MTGEIDDSIQRFIKEEDMERPKIGKIRIIGEFGSIEKDFTGFQIDDLINKTP